jgi:hypothetical protein
MTNELAGFAGFAPFGRMNSSCSRTKRMNEFRLMDERELIAPWLSKIAPLRLMQRKRRARRRGEEKLIIVIRHCVFPLITSK